MWVCPVIVLCLPLPSHQLYPTRICCIQTDLQVFNGSKITVGLLGSLLRLLNLLHDGLKLCAFLWKGEKLLCWHTHATTRVSVKESRRAQNKVIPELTRQPASSSRQKSEEELCLVSCKGIIKHRILLHKTLSLLPQMSMSVQRNT